jgi:hypothetical protein
MNLQPQLADQEIPLFTIYIQDQELYFIPLVGFNCQIILKMGMSQLSDVFKDFKNT